MLWQATVHARHVHERSELNVAGTPRLERGTKVLETLMIPFHHVPNCVPGQNRTAIKGSANPHSIH